MGSYKVTGKDKPSHIYGLYLRYLPKKKRTRNPYTNYYNITK